MAITLDAVDAYATALEGVEVGRKWDTRTWMVGNRGFAWERPLRKSDVERLGATPSPQGDIVAVMVDGLDAKDALLAIGLSGFFTIPHFNGYAAVLIELRKARAADVRAALAAAHRAAVAAGPVKPRKPRPKTRTKKPRAKSARARSG
jgi:hypothetical protein